MTGRERTRTFRGKVWRFHAGRTSSGDRPLTSATRSLFDRTPVPGSGVSRVDHHSVTAIPSSPMALFDDERLTRLTISVTRAQRRRLGELARRAGRGITMARVARAALDAGLDAVSEAMDRERTAAATDGGGAE